MVHNCAGLLVFFAIMTIIAVVISAIIVNLIGGGFGLWLVLSMLIGVVEMGFFVKLIGQ